MPDIDPQILSSLISAGVSSVVVIIGFFVFHILASRRQNRDECLSLSKDFLQTLESYEQQVSTAWKKDGKTAVADGHPYKSKAIAIELSTMLEVLSGKSKAFSLCSHEFSELRKCADEFGEPGKGNYYHVQDLSRTKKLTEHPEFAKHYFLLRQSVRRALAKRFK